MSIQAVFFDLGGVIVRTEYQAPRQQLEERLGMDYDDLNKIVFDSDTGVQASTGAITSQQHWEAVMKRLKRPFEEMTSIRDEFFAGDIVDRDILNFLRSLRGRYKTGLISNAWSDLRDYLVRERMTDAFDHIIISAEVGVAKPEPRIFAIALQQAGVSPGEAVFVDDFYAKPRRSRSSSTPCRSPTTCRGGGSGSCAATRSSSARWRASSPISTTAPSRRSRSRRSPRWRARRTASEIRDMYQSLRNVLCEGLNAAGWRVEKPKATMFVWAPIPEPYRAMGSLEFLNKLLSEARVAVSPGIGFGEHGDDYVRLGLIENEHRTRQAVRAIRVDMFRRDGGRPRSG